MRVERYIAELESPRGARRRNVRFAEGLVAAVLLLVLTAAYGMLQEQRARDAREYVRHTLAMQEAATQLETASGLMEIQHRGFLIRGDTEARVLRERAHAQGQRSAGELLRLVASDPTLSAETRRAIDAFEARHARMLDSTRVADTQGLEAARRRVPLQGIGSVDAVFARLDAVRAHQARLLASQSALAERQAGHFRVVLAVGTVLALVLVTLITVLMLRQLSRNARLGAKLLEAHLLQKQKTIELERSNRDLEAFTYTISHDLRAPLRHIDGYVRMLQEDAGDALEAEPRRYLDTISDSARRMGALIDDLLAYSRLGRKPLDCARLDMNALTERVLPDAGAGASAATVEVGTLPEAWGDPVLLRQAWVNLLSNAIKYSAPKGAEARIEVSGERDGDRVRYRIRDNGVGFDMRYADKLFGVFQRMHSQDDFEGTGVGLAIVQQVVHRHGGHVSAESTPGQGACFTIELPMEGA
ncbi:MAG: sensor histidine kinase [Lysobacteraceae bacterium]